MHPAPNSYVEVLIQLSELDWMIIQQIFNHFPIPLEQSIFSCPTDFGLGHLTCFGQWNVIMQYKQKL